MGVGATRGQSAADKDGICVHSVCIPEVPALSWDTAHAQEHLLSTME